MLAKVHDQEACVCRIHVLLSRSVVVLLGAVILGKNCCAQAHHDFVSIVVSLSSLSTSFTKSTSVPGDNFDRVAYLLELCTHPKHHALVRTFASFSSLSTSSATLATFTPALRFAGDSTLTVASRGEMSNPSDSAVMLSMGFFLARMIFGRVENLHSRDRKL